MTPPSEFYYLSPMARAVYIYLSSFKKGLLRLWPVTIGAELGLSAADMDGVIKELAAYGLAFWEKDLPMFWIPAFPNPKRGLDKLPKCRLLDKALKRASQASLMDYIEPAEVNLEKRYFSDDKVELPKTGDTKIQKSLEVQPTLEDLEAKESLEVEPKVQSTLEDLEAKESLEVEPKVETALEEADPDILINNLINTNTRAEEDLINNINNINSSSSPTPITQSNFCGSDTCWVFDPSPSPSSPDSSSPVDSVLNDVIGYIDTDPETGEKEFTSVKMDGGRYDEIELRDCPAGEIIREAPGDNTPAYGNINRLVGDNTPAGDNESAFHGEKPPALVAVEGFKKACREGLAGGDSEFVATVEDYEVATDLLEDPASYYQVANQPFGFMNCRGEEEFILRTTVDYWKKTLPDLDIEKELAGIAVWLYGNYNGPTRKGPQPGRASMESFIANCLRVAAKKGNKKPVYKQRGKPKRERETPETKLAALFEKALAGQKQYDKYREYGRE